METFFYNGKNKQGLYDLIMKCEIGKLWRFRIDEYDEKTRLQEEKYHAMLGDISRQAKHLNRNFDADAWKRLCVAQYRLDCIENDLPRLADYWKRHSVELVPSLYGTTLVALGAQTRDFPKYVAAGFIEWLYHFGANNNIVWTEPARAFDERYAA